MCGSTKVANLLINSRLAGGLVATLRKSTLPSVRMRAAAVLGLLIRHATCIEPSFSKSGERPQADRALCFRLQCIDVRRWVLPLHVLLKHGIIKGSVRRRGGGACFRLARGERQGQAQADGHAGGATVFCGKPREGGTPLLMADGISPRENADGRSLQDTGPDESWQVPHRVAEVVCSMLDEGQDEGVQVPFQPN